MLEHIPSTSWSHPTCPSFLGIWCFSEDGVAGTPDITSGRGVGVLAEPRAERRV